MKREMFRLSLLPTWR